MNMLVLNIKTSKCPNTVNYGEDTFNLSICSGDYSLWWRNIFMSDRAIGEC